MREILIIFSLVTIFSCNQKSGESASDNTEFYMPAEWEAHDAIWLGWRERKNTQFQEGVAELIKTLTPTVAVKVAVSSDSLLRVAKVFLDHQNVDLTRVKFYVMPGDQYWIRDYGAAFLINKKGELGVADFGFDQYGLPEFL